MKASLKANHVSVREKTHPILVEAGRLLAAYAKATGTQISVLDRNCVLIPELFEENTTDKNLCLFCMKYKKSAEVKKVDDFFQNPCREMHDNAIREAHRFGGTFTYMCPLGFIFWTSPVYADEHFIGALLAGGYLGVEKEEACAQMQEICDGELHEKKLLEKLAPFSRGEPQKIKALAELLLTCAESLSSESNNYYATMRRRARQQADLSAKIEELKHKYPANCPRPAYPMEKERNILEALRRGDTRTAREVLNELLAELLFSNPNDYKHIQYRALELAVLLSRTDHRPVSETILETSRQYLNTIQEARNIEELTDALCRIVDDMGGHIFSFQGVRHASALKKAECFIMENFTRKISLGEIAKASGFSAPYFSTIFKEEMGENLSSYLNRLRVEKAGYMLINTNSSLSKITRACGFEDQSWFSKIFKAYTGMSPGKYRSHGGKPASKTREPALRSEPEPAI